MPAVSAFTEEFAKHLREIVDEADVSRQAIADEAGRSRAFVSDQLLGKRPVDTDVIGATAAVLGVPARFLVRQIMDAMPRDLFGIPGVNPDADRQAADDLAKKRAERPAKQYPQPVKKSARRDPKGSK